MTAVEVDAPAKVNLRLRVLAQQTSGYHSLESLFCALSLHDTVVVRRGGDAIRLAVEGAIDTGPPEDNLALRAARRLLLEVGEVGDGVTIELHKRIPAAAGLGGGSSDAAATLRAVNLLLGSPLPDSRLVELGGELGSDVPFFLCGSPLALGWGRGERLLALRPLPPQPVLIAHPRVAMPTGQAFQRIAEMRGGGYEPPAICLGADRLASWEGVEGIAGNDFQDPAEERVAVLAPARRAMEEAGARIALLAGSGASLVGIFAAANARDAAEAAVTDLGLDCWRADTLAEMPAPRRLHPPRGPGAG